MAKHKDADSNDNYISGSLYVFLKYLSLILLPGLATFYAALSNVWNLSDVEQVVITITAVDTFIGSLIGLTSAGRSNQNVIDGDMHVISTEDGNKKTMSLALDNTPEELANKNVITLKVRHRPSPK